MLKSYRYLLLHLFIPVLNSDFRTGSFFPGLIYEWYPDVLVKNILFVTQLSWCKIISTNDISAVLTDIPEIIFK